MPNEFCDIFGHPFHSIRLRPSTLIRYVCISVLIHLVSKAFSNRCVFDENAQRISADGRPKRVELYAFSNENALVCSGPKATLLLP